MTIKSHFSIDFQNFCALMYVLNLKRQNNDRCGSALSFSEIQTFMSCLSQKYSILRHSMTIKIHFINFFCTFCEMFFAVICNGNASIFTLCWQTMLTRRSDAVQCSVKGKLFKIFSSKLLQTTEIFLLSYAFLFPL